MPKLTPTAQAALGALNDGPANVHELRERINRSRSATDKAIGELAAAALISKVPGDLGDGAPTRWQLADGTEPVHDGTADAEPATTAHDPDQPEDIPVLLADNLEPASAAPEFGDHHAAAAQTSTDDQSADGQADTTDDIDAADPVAAGAAPATGTSDEDTAAITTSAQVTASDPHDAAETAPGTSPEPSEDSTPDGSGAAGTGTVTPDQPKLCRGCQAQLPKTCPDCWQKTPAYCGTCRKDMPATRRGEPGEPQILSNGLPKLRPGELENMVLQVIAEHPLPHHVGITGWTGSRVAVYLPGRSNGAINNALEKLARSGKAELIGDGPMRYRLADTDTTSADRDTSAPDSGDTAPHDADPTSGTDDPTYYDTSQSTAEATTGEEDAW